MSAMISNYPVLPMSLWANLLADSKLPLTINRILYKHWPNEAIQITHSTNALKYEFESVGGDNLKVVEDLIIAALVERFQMELWETDESHVGFVHDYHVSLPKLNSKGAMRIMAKAL